MPSAQHLHTWQNDHEDLAFLLASKGDPARAAGEFSKLSRTFLNRADYALYAGAAYVASGHQAEAAPYFLAASRQLGDSVVRRAGASLVKEARMRAKAIAESSQPNHSPR